MRLPLNCWLVAMWIWLRANGRPWAAVRRSRSLRGAVPHFGVIAPCEDGLYLLEYIPRRPKLEKSGSGDSWPLFHGKYRLARYRLERMVTGETFAGVAAQISKQTGN